MSNMIPVTSEELKNLLGDTAYNKLVAEFGGRYVYINKKKQRFENPYFKLPIEQRNILIMEDYNNGKKARELSEKYGLDLRYTHNLIKKLKQKEGNTND